MSKFEKNYLADLFSTLGAGLLNPGTDLQCIIEDERQYNAWFTKENVERAVRAIGLMLNRADLQNWLETYPVPVEQPKRIGLVLAGNIPMVGFHDVLCVLISGHHALIKPSSQDSRLIPEILRQLTALEPAFEETFSFVPRLSGFDAVIATGNDNSSRYFDYYFGKVPHIIRRNRNSVAVLYGSETKQELSRLGYDIFDYFGLGCRNVSKIFVPEGYDFGQFFRAIEAYAPVIHHHKYNNNYDYNKSIYLVNREQHLDNGFLLLKEDRLLSSPLAVLYYEEYSDHQALAQRLAEQADQIQCIVSEQDSPGGISTVRFGQSQQPRLWDYADGVDTLAFLTKL